MSAQAAAHSDASFAGLPVDEALETLLALVLSAPLEYATEYDLHDAISERLDDARVPHDVEVRLDEDSRLDLLVDGRIAVEVKRGDISSAAAVLAQTERYLEHERVQALLLVTDRVAHRLPAAVHGKPVAVAHLAHLAVVPSGARAVDLDEPGDMRTDGKPHTEVLRCYGSLVHDGGRWLITAEPDVARRVKRNLPRWDSGRRGAIALTDTAEICHELRWLLERWPLRVSRKDLNRLRRGDRTHVKRLDAIHAIRTGAYETPKRFDVGLEPYDHQVVGAEMAIAGGGLLLGDMLGTGKTITSALAARAEGGLPAIVCPPPNLALQWQRELKRLYPTLTSYVIPTGPTHDIATQMPDGRFPDFVILAHSRMQKWVDDVLAQSRYPTVLLEEAHEFVNPNAERTKAARQLARQADCCVPITGTPVLNYGVDMYHLLDLAQPDAFGTLAEFQTEWCHSDGGHWLVSDPSALRSAAEERGVYLRRTMRDIGHLLPPLTIESPEIDIDLEVIDEGMRQVEDLARLLITKTGSGLEMMQAGSQFSGELRRLTGVAKAPSVAALARMLLASRERVVIFAWHRQVIDILRSHLAEFSPLLYTGSESVAEKDQHAAAFCDPNGSCRVLIMSLRSGAGLDGLQKVCQTAIFAELDWSASRHLQAIGRLHRLGQRWPVAALFPWGDGGSDPFVLSRIALKRLQADPFIDEEIPEDQILQVDPHHVYGLARTFLNERGVDVAAMETERDERRRLQREVERELRRRSAALRKRLRALGDPFGDEAAALRREITAVDVETRSVRNAATDDMHSFLETPELGAAPIA